MKRDDPLVILVVVAILLVLGGILGILIYQSISPRYEEKNYRYENSDCVLMRNSKGEFGCFGCSPGRNGAAVCKDPASDFQPYQFPKDYVGIPYSCSEGVEGCELVE